MQNHKPSVRAAYDYACWIGPDNAVMTSLPDGETELTCLEKGFVRAEFGQGSTLYVKGFLTDLTRTWDSWKALGAAVARVKVCLPAGDADDPGGGSQIHEPVAFDLPEQLDDLKAFLSVEEATPMAG